MKKEDRREKRVSYDTINVYPETKERFCTKFKQYKETDDEALNRIMDKAGVGK